MASCTTVGFNKFHRDSKNHAERPWLLILLSDKNCALRDEASNSTSAAGTNPGKIQWVIPNSLTSGISLGQSFQDGYPLLANDYRSRLYSYGYDGKLIEDARPYQELQDKLG
jgi:hypothetical protein